MNGLLLVLCLNDTTKPLSKDVSNSPFMTNKVKGELYRKPFIPNKVEVKKIGIQKVTSFGKTDKSMQWAIKFRNGTDFFADQEIAIWVSIDVNEKLDGLSFKEKPHRFMEDSGSDFMWKGKERNVGMGITSVFLSRKDNMSGDNIVSDRFSARISFGKQVGKQIPGKIVLAMPDGKGYLSGTFTAVFN
jgi:hypothetical protein